MVVLRAANQNLLIAGGNHTMISPMNHRRYIAWYHSTAQVLFETWRAADCRPYRRGTAQPQQVVFETLHGAAPRSGLESSEIKAKRNDP